MTGLYTFLNKLAGLIYLLIAIYLINPENKIGTIEFTEGNEKQKLLFFASSVSDNVPKALVILSIIYIILTLPGSLLTKYDKVK